MGDVDKPFGSNDTSSSCDQKTSCSDSSQSKNSQPFVAEDLLSMLTRLRSIGKLVRADSSGLSRQFFWAYFKRELEELQCQEESASAIGKNQVANKTG